MPPEAFSSQIHRELLDLAADGLLRSPGTINSPPAKTAVVDGREVRVFCSNNYLDLAGDPRLLAAVRDGLDRWGWGSGASRLVCGTTSAHELLSRQLAEFKGCEAVVLFSTGYMANLGVLTALASAGDVLLIDKLCHASIIDAAGASRATARFFPHNDIPRLARLLERHAQARRLCIVTEGLFSMDGDFGFLPEIVSLKKKFGALLIVDDAHGSGLLGKHGRGTPELLEVESEVDITIGTLSKAFGSLGGFVCCSRDLAEYLTNRSRSYIYTTAAPAAMCLAASAALRIVRDEPQRRVNLAAVSARLRDGLRRIGFDLGSAQAHIVPVILGRAELAVQASQRLFERGFMVPAIRQPTVASGKARLRISLMSSHSDQDIDELIEALAQIGRDLALF